MYNNPYINAYNPQPSLDRINAQINELENMKKQIQQPQQLQQPTNLTQNFQLAPTNNNVIKYANSIDEVQRNMVLGDTPFFSNDMSIVWIKNTNNEIKTYELNEIIPKDEKDIQIEFLMAQINELKGMIKNESNDTNVNAEQITTNTTTNDESNGNATKTSKPTSVSRISTSKKK